MHRLIFPAISLVLAVSAAERRPMPLERSDPGGVLRQLTIARFDASGQTSIQAAATDANGNLFVTGTTNAPDFPVRNAAQGALGDARILRTTDLGATWTKVGNPPGDVTTIVPDPTTAQVLFAGGANGIYKSSDGGATWRQVHASATTFLTIDPGNHLRLAAVAPG